MLSSDSAPKRSYTSFLVVSVIAVRLWAGHCRCSLLLASGGDAQLALSIVRMSCEGVEVSGGYSVDLVLDEWYFGSLSGVCGC
jgi:hypothetical protein